MKILQVEIILRDLEIYEFAANCFGKLLTSLIIYLALMITIYSEERLIQ